MVPEWVKGLAQSWGHEMRKFEAKIGNLQGTMGRIRDEGPDGAAIRGKGDYVPDIDLPNEVRKFHLAWLDLDYPLRNILWLDFKEPGPAKKKMAELECSKQTYYRKRAEALVKIAVDFHLYE